MKFKVQFRHVHTRIAWAARTVEFLFPLLLARASKLGDISYHLKYLIAWSKKKKREFSWSHKYLYSYTISKCGDLTSLNKTLQTSRLFLCHKNEIQLYSETIQLACVMNMSRESEFNSILKD